MVEAISIRIDKKSIFVSVPHFDLRWLHVLPFMCQLLMKRSLHCCSEGVTECTQREVTLERPLSIRGFSQTYQGLLMLSGWLLVVIDPFSPSDSLCSISPIPRQFYSVSPSVMWSWEVFRTAAGAAVTGTAGTLNWLPWGPPFGGAEQGSNGGGMLTRTRAHAGLV